MRPVGRKEGNERRRTHQLTGCFQVCLKALRKMGLGIWYDLSFDGIKECPANHYYETIWDKIGKGKKEESTFNRLFPSLPKSSRPGNSLKYGAWAGIWWDKGMPGKPLLWDPSEENRERKEGGVNTQQAVFQSAQKPSAVELFERWGRAGVWFIIWCDNQMPCKPLLWDQTRKNREKK